MNPIVVVGIFAGLVLSLGGCGISQFQTLIIFDSPDRVVALRVMPDAYGGQGFDHPASFTVEEMSDLLRGVRVQRGLLSSISHAALSEGEVRLFSPYFVEALQQATNEEMVTFFETAEINGDYQLTTSGGLFVAGGNFHFVLSNFSVKTPLWQDNEQYEASYRSRPLEQMDPQPGGLFYEPRQFMVKSPEGEIGSHWKGKPWQVAIRYQDVLRKENIN